MKKKGANVAKAKKKSPAKKAATKKPAAKKPTPKKVAAKKSVAKKLAPKKTAPKKAVAKKAAPKKSNSPKMSTKTSSTKSSQKPAKLVDLSQFMTPLDDRMVVQVMQKEAKTAGGLYIPDTVTDVAGHKEGTVVAVGRGHRDVKGRMRPMDVQKGDKVLFSSFSGSKFEYQNFDLLILRESDVMGVVG